MQHKTESGNKTEKKCVVDVLAVDSSSKTLMLSKTTDTILKNGEEIKKNEEKKEEEKKEEEKKNENTSEVVIPTARNTTGLYRKTTGNGKKQTPTTWLAIHSTCLVKLTTSMFMPFQAKAVFAQTPSR